VVYRNCQQRKEIKPEHKYETSTNVTSVLMAELPPNEMYKQNIAVAIPFPVPDVPGSYLGSMADRPN
jgi:hypothetical protein